MNGNNIKRRPNSKASYSRVIGLLGRRLCSYKDCTSHLRKTQKGTIYLFSFPVKDTERIVEANLCIWTLCQSRERHYFNYAWFILDDMCRCSIWITNSGREEFRYLTPKELANKRICELHFEEFMFSNFFKTNLKKNAVPNQFDKVTPEMFQNNDDDSNDEGESGIASESSSNHNNHDLINAFSNKPSENLIEDQVIEHTFEKKNAIVYGETTSHNKCESVQYLLPAEFSLNRKESPTTVSSVKEFIRSPRSSSYDILRHSLQQSTVKQNTKFHNLPPQTMQNDFYFQACSESAEETNNSMPEPLEGEMPLFVQQDSVVSLADEPANSDHFEPLTKRRRRDKDDEDLSDQIRGAVKDLKSITSLLSNNDDEFDLFGKIVALQLKKMSLCTALEVQAKIQTLLSQHRISDIQKERQKNKSVTKLIENHEGNVNKEVRKRENGNGEDFNAELETAESPQLLLSCASENLEIDFSENN